jgi:hypothetical protein
MGKKRKRQRAPNAAEREAAAERARERAAEQAAQAEADRQLAAMSPEDRAELERLRVTALEQQEAQRLALHRRGVELTIEWSLCGAYVPVNFEGEVRCIDATICPMCGVLLPRQNGPDGLPACPNRQSAIRERKAEQAVDERVKLLTEGTAFS